MTTPLRTLCDDWEKWARSADKSEEGWPSDYPDWDRLMEAAKEVMNRPTLQPQELRDLELCWRISEEGETLADYAKDHVSLCWDKLQYLSQSSHPTVRWQVYEVLGHAGPSAEPLLHVGLQDPDGYCKRRAILSLARLKPRNAKQLSERFLRDEDPYIRQAAAELLKASPD